MIMIDLRDTKINCMKEDGSIDHELIELYESECAKQGITKVHGGGKPRGYLFCEATFQLGYAIEYMPPSSRSLEHFNNTELTEVTKADLIDFERVPDRDPTINWMEVAVNEATDAVNELLKAMEAKSAKESAAVTTLKARGHKWNGVLWMPPRPAEVEKGVQDPLSKKSAKIKRQASNITAMHKKIKELNEEVFHLNEVIGRAMRKSEQPKGNEPRATYEKVTFNKLSEAFAEHEKSPLYGLVDGMTMEYKELNPLYIIGGASLYRKAEITPMQAAKKACSDAWSMRDRVIKQNEVVSLFEIFAADFDDDAEWDAEFMCICRAIVEAYDGK